MFIWCHKNCTWLPLLPLAVVVMMLVGACTTYILSVAQGHVAAIFPFISDTGTEIPESSLFSFFLVCTGALTFFTSYFRYRIVRLLTKCHHTIINGLSAFCMFLSILFSIGLAIVGCFQDDKMPTIHLIGANMIFVSGVLYTFLDFIVSWLICTHFEGRRWLCYVRLIVSMCTLVFFIITTTTDNISKQIWQNTTHVPPHDKKKQWSPNESGYGVHIMATFSEWLMAFSFLGYFLTFFFEFRHFKFFCVLQKRDTVLQIDDIPDDNSSLLN